MNTSIHQYINTSGYIGGGVNIIGRIGRKFEVEV